MKSHFLALGIFLIYSLPAGPSFGQAPKISVERLEEAGNVELGLINTIIQDKNGFMWFGTFAGLYKYDGYRFTVFTRDSSNPNSISLNWIDSIFEDKSGVLWIGTFGGGLNRYNRATNDFTRYVHDPTNDTSISPGAVRVLHEDRNGTFWVGTDLGLNQLDRETGVFKHYVHPQNDPPELHGSRVRSLLEDGAGRLWIGTGEVAPTGLYRFDPQLETFVHFVNDPGNTRSLFNNNVEVIHEDKRGNIWVGTFGEVLHRYDPERGDFERYLVDPKDPDSFKAIRENTISYGGNDLTKRGIESIIERRDEPGVLWMSTANLGLLRFDVASRSFVDYSSDLPSLPFNNLGLFEDRENKIWTAALLGVLIINADVAGVRHFAYSNGNSQGLYPDPEWRSGVNIYKDKQGTRWIPYSNLSIDRLSPENGSISHNPDFFPEKLSRIEYRDVLMDTKSDWWFAGSDGALWQFVPEARELKHYPGTSSQTYSQLYEDYSGKVWSTLGGLSFLDQKSKSLHTYQLVDGQHEYYPGAVNYVDRGGSVWMQVDRLDRGAASGGLGKLDLKTHTFELLIQGIFPLDVIEDSRNNIWVGSLGDGIICVDSTGRTLKTLTVADGLPLNRIDELFKDEQDNIFIKVGRELLKLDPVSYHLQRIKLPQSATVESYLGRDHSGDLYYRDKDGIMAITPRLLKTDTIPPPVVFTDFRIDNLPVPIGKNSPLKSHISVTQELTLSYDQHNVAFEFAALDFDSPADNTYSYLLENYDDAWINAGTLRTATYTNLDPGSYKIRVKAANSDGIWNEEGASIAITILPPLWRTVWAYAFYALLFAAGVFAVDRFQRRRLVARERLRAEREQARAIASTNAELQRALQHLTETQDQLVHSQKMASLGSLTAGIAHELKNPLNFVNNFAELSSELTGELVDLIEEERERLTPANAHQLKGILDDLRMNTQKINEHGRRADGIIRAMLDHARTQPGGRDAVDLNGLLDEYVNLAFHGMRARVPEFSSAIERKYDGAVGKVEVVPQEIGRVFLNLLDNAFYAVHQKQASTGPDYAPTIWVETTRGEDFVEVRVKDNGPGVPHSVREKIFEPFFTTKPAGSGTGLGLSLGYDIVVKGHGGSLTVESDEPSLSKAGEAAPAKAASGEGAIFVIRLPT